MTKDNILYANVERWIDTETKSVMKIFAKEIKGEHLQQMINKFGDDKFVVSKMEPGDVFLYFTVGGFFQCFAVAYSEKMSISDVLLPYHVTN